MKVRTQFLLIAMFGLAIRLAYTLALGRDDNPESPFGDAFFFHAVANLVADGRGFSHPFYSLLQGYDAPTAAHPPLWPLVLSLFSTLGVTGETSHRLVGNLVGTGVVVLTGLVGRRVGGDRVGLIAAGLAAVYPVLVAADGSLMSEPLAALLVLASLLATYRYLDKPGAAAAAVLGIAVGCAGLARSEAVVLFVLLALPAVWWVDRRRDLAVVLCAALVVVGPWTIRNAVAFDAFVPISTNLGSVIGGANCDLAYSGRHTGSWIPACAFGAASPPNDGRAYAEAELARRWRLAGQKYALDHAERWPAVVGVRVLRTWGLWQPQSQASANEGQNRGFARVAVLAYYPVALLALFGGYLLRARRRELWVLFGPALAITLASVAAYGTYRFRHTAEPVLVVLAACALGRLIGGRPGEREGPPTKGNAWRN